MSKHSREKSKESANIENNLIHLGLLSTSSRPRKDSTSHKPPGAQNKGGFRPVARINNSLFACVSYLCLLKDSVDLGLEL